MGVLNLVRQNKVCKKPGQAVRVGEAINWHILIEKQICFVICCFYGAVQFSKWVAIFGGGGVPVCIFYKK
jgi:hypothetical protein